MRITLELDVDLTAAPKVRVARMDLRPGGQPVGPRELAAIRYWLGVASPGNYLNVDGSILPSKARTPDAIEQGDLIVTLLQSIDGKLGRLLTGGGG